MQPAVESGGGAAAAARRRGEGPKCALSQHQPEPVRHDSVEQELALLPHAAERAEDVSRLPDLGGVGAWVRG